MTKSLNHTFYKNTYTKHGISPQGVHWSSQETQYKRFEVLVNFIKKDISNSNILDVGCGFGDLLDFFEKNNIKLKKTYTGIDCEEFFIKIAQKRFENELFYKCDILKDYLPKADFLICSGALNLLKKDDFLLAIQRCFESSNIGFAFNFINDEQTSFHKLKEKIIFDFLKTLSPNIQIKKNYLKNDCSVFLKK